jgi:hypothetical protein
VRRNHLDAAAAQLLIQWTAVVSAIADEVLWLRLDHVEVETELNQTLRGGWPHACRPRAVAIHNCYDFQDLPTLPRGDLCAAAIAIAKVAS